MDKSVATKALFTSGHFKIETGLQRKSELGQMVTNGKKSVVFSRGKSCEIFGKR